MVVIICGPFFPFRPSRHGAQHKPACQGCSKDVCLLDGLVYPVPRTVRSPAQLRSLGRRKIPGGAAGVSAPFPAGTHARDVERGCTGMTRLDTSKGWCVATAGHTSSMLMRTGSAVSPREPTSTRCPRTRRKPLRNGSRPRPRSRNRQPPVRKGPGPKERPKGRSQPVWSRRLSSFGPHRPINSGDRQLVLLR